MEFGFCDGSNSPAFPHGGFMHVPIPRITPHLEIGLRALRQEHLPSLFELCAGVVECRRRSVLMFAGMRAGIEAAAPFPKVGVVRVADARGDGAGSDIAIIDLPALVAGGLRIDGGLALACGHSSAGRGVRQWPARPRVR